MHMEIANVVLFLLISILSLPCFLLLIILTEALLRAATPLLQRQALSHFAWPPNSAFRRTAPPATFRTKSPPSPPSNAALRVATYKRADVSFSSLASASASASAAAAAEHADDACCCVFCLCDVEEGDEIREIPCRHVFHRRCLDTWLQHRHATCPLCRNRLREVGDEDEDELEESATILVAYVHSSGWWAR
ncbi:putative E3 ubiquitin-protein ligase RHA2B [Ananas comosus]|nr:putative E3 ubiquitin-protein ligase RHA2B [Ananas comosus]